MTRTINVSVSLAKELRSLIIGDIYQSAQRKDNGGGGGSLIPSPIKRPKVFKGPGLRVNNKYNCFLS